MQKPDEDPPKRTVTWIRTEHPTPHQMSVWDRLWQRLLAPPSTESQSQDDEREPHP